MSDAAQPCPGASPAPDFDVMIVGAGMSGLYQLHRVRELGLSVQVIEEGDDVGGTWYWNRYPGARFDSESYTYGYSFSPELLQEWNWSEHFAPQPETLRYVNHLADRLDLRRHIRFGRRVTSASWDEPSRSWRLLLDDGSRSSARFLVTAIGALSVPTLPRIEDIDCFQGQSCHTARWPKEPVSFEGRRVAVVGTGATGVQTIQEVAKKLIPKNHGFGTRRLPLETRYYEVYNQPNVELVDLVETPIERVTPTGIRTTAREFEFDMIIYATGFDALTGAYDSMEIRGTGGRRLKEQWDRGARTFLGIQNAGFPNLLMVMGPMGALGNIPRSIEYNVEWVTGLLRHMRDHGITQVEAPQASVDAWMEVVAKAAEGLLSNEVSSWMTGVNSNVEGRTTRVLGRYSGTGPEYRSRCDAVAAGGYRELVLG